MDHTLLFLADIKAIFRELSMRDMAKVLGGLITLSIFFVPLKGIDRKHEITQLTYIVFISAFCSIQWFVIPSRVNAEFSLIDFLIGSMLFVLLASMKWIRGQQTFQIVSREVGNDKSSKKQGGP